METGDPYPDNGEFGPEWQQEPGRGYSSPQGAEADDGVIDERSQPQPEADDEAEAAINAAREQGLTDKREIEIYATAFGFAGRVRAALESDDVMLVETSSEYNDPETGPGRVRRYVTRAAYFQEVDEADPQQRPAHIVVHASWDDPIEPMGGQTESWNSGEVSATCYEPHGGSQALTITSRVDYSGSGEEARGITSTMHFTDVAEPNPEREFVGDVVYDSLGVESIGPVEAVQRLPGDLVRVMDAGEMLTDHLHGWLTGSEPGMHTTSDSEPAERFRQAAEQAGNRDQHGVQHRVLDRLNPDDLTTIRATAPGFKDLLNYWADHFPLNLVVQGRPYRRNQQL